MINQNKMKTQSEFLNQEIGRTYFEQYFETQTDNPISTKDYDNIKSILDDAVILLSQGAKIELVIQAEGKNKYSMADLRNAYRWGTKADSETSEHFSEFVETLKSE